MVFSSLSLLRGMMLMSHSAFSSVDVYGKERSGRFAVVWEKLQKGENCFNLRETTEKKKQQTWQEKRFQAELVQQLSQALKCIFFHTAAVAWAWGAKQKTSVFRWKVRIQKKVVPAVWWGSRRKKRGTRKKNKFHVHPFLEFGMRQSVCMRWSRWGGGGGHWVQPDVTHSRWN